MVFLSVVTFSYEIITSYGSSKKEHVTGLALSSLGFFFMGEKKKSETNVRVCKQLLGQRYSNFRVHPNRLGILLKCRV